MDRGPGDELGWKVAPTMRPCRTRTGSPRHEARTSTPGPTDRILGARIKTASSLSAPGTEVSISSRKLSTWVP